MRDVTISVGVGRLSGSGLVHWRVEMLLIPELCAVRVFLVHVHVVEALHRHVSLVFHNGPVGTLQIRKASPSAWLDAFGLGFSDLRLAQPQDPSRAGPGIVSHNN